MRVAPSPPAGLALRTAIAAPLAALLGLVLLLAACGGDATPGIVIVTMTHTPEPVVVVITATHTPTPDAREPVATSTVATSTVLPTKIAATQEPVATDTPKLTSPPQASLPSYRVVYSNFDGGDQSDEFKYSVWMMRGDGQQADEILRPAIEPSFSVNGNKIAYYRPFNGIWVYDLATKSNTPVVVSDYAEFGGFSPDGQRLVFHEWVGNWASSDVNLYIVNIDGSGRTQLPQGIRPAWSPQGGLITFDTCRDTSCGIFVVQPDGGGFRQVTNDAGGKASWAPGGNKIVYSADVDGDPEIWVVNLDGSGRMQLTNNNGNDTLPVFSPDGQYIYFLSDQNGTAWAIQAMRPDGTDVKTVRQVGVAPRWQFSRLWVTWW